MAYKSARLLTEAINKEMEAIRKAAMGNMALGPLNDLRDLVAELSKMADRTAVDDVHGMAPADYVATMKPLVAEYHRLLMMHNQLAPCLLMDLRANACILIAVGDGKSVVKAAHDPDHPEAALIVETLLASLDEGTKRVAEDAAAAAEQATSGEAFAGIDLQRGSPLSYESSPPTMETLEAGLEATLRDPTEREP